MNGTSAFSSFMAEYLWWMPYAQVFIAAYFLIHASRAAYRALWLWRNRDQPDSDPVIAKALPGVKPPRYALHAVGWSVLAAMSSFAALFGTGGFA